MREAILRVGGYVDYTTDKKAPSGRYLGGEGTVLSINGDKVTVDCMYSGRVTVSIDQCYPIAVGY